MGLQHNEKDSLGDGRVLMTKEKTPKSTAWARKNPDRVAEQQRRKRNTLRGALNSKVSAARQRARNKNLPFDLDVNFVNDMWESQSGKCALTGKQMTYRGNKNSQESFDSFSIDRIDSTKGYTRDNIQLVKWGVNSIKSSMSMDVFFKLVADLYVFNDLGEKE